VTLRRAIGIPALVFVLLLAMFGGSPYVMAEPVVDGGGKAQLRAASDCPDLVFGLPAAGMKVPPVVAVARLPLGLPEWADVRVAPGKGLRCGGYPRAGFRRVCPPRPAWIGVVEIRI
jgi:hypothetical protein